MVEIFFENDAGRRLAASLELPDGEGPFPVVVFAHGFNSGRFSGRNRAIAECLLEQGVAALLIDFTGHGDSEGTIEEATIDRMIGDLTAVVDFLDARPELDSRRIGVSGSSSGGIVTVRFASRDRRPTALVLRSVPAERLFGAAGRIEVPTLVIAGTADIQIVEEDRALAEALGGEHEFRTIEGAGHLFETEWQAKEVAELSADWFVTKLLKPATT